MFKERLRSTFEGVKIDGDGEFVCKCGFRARDYRVQKDKSPYYGQQYYACSKHGSDPTQCRTWIWFDEKDRVRKSIPPEMRSPQTPRKQVDIRKYGLYTPPTTLKRKAETQSFDSGVGDLENTEEPAPPSPSQSAKRARSADAATQTTDTSTRADVRPMPRRRLFEEFLNKPKNNAGANTDLAVVQEPRRKGSLFGSSLRERPRNHSEAEIPALSAGDTESNSKAPLAPRSCVLARSRSRRVHFTPPTPISREADTRITQLNADSDAESYGWNDDMAGDIVDVARTVENPPSSPLFV
ncbi:hypothetical protein BJY01DRAFT_202532 [Aspergillus pseudoustus]|uniref:Zinc finger GRF-type domain-containing protein n=1 Tax=Aspergillus pseudoustus TaxID=1810923 RepID=A0ABR4KYA9_9EURO